MTRLKAFFGKYHWHWALLRLAVGIPVMGFILIGNAGDRLYDWFDEALPDARKED